MKAFCSSSMVLLFLIFGATNLMGQGIRVESAFYGMPFSSAAMMSPSGCVRGSIGRARGPVYPLNESVRECVTRHP
jgi:hypothetical protein